MKYTISKIWYGGLHLAKKSLQNRCGETEKYVIHVGADFPYKKYGLREASQIGQMFIPLCEKERQNSNRSSNFDCNWASFYSKQKENIKNADVRVWGDARGDQKLDTFLGLNIKQIKLKTKLQY